MSERESLLDARRRPLRVERASEAGRLRALGLTQQQVADRMGISRSYAQALLGDPEGAQDAARKASYGGTCKVCGKRTDGSNGRANAPRLCAEHEAQRAHDERFWTAGRVLEQIERFVERHGRKPWSHEWLRAKPADPDEPFVETSLVLREFGSWNNAMRAAGLPAEAPGKFIRQTETLVRMRTAQRGRHHHARDYGDLVQARINIGRDQLAALSALDGVVMSEHVRRAIDSYLAQEAVA